ncbi:MAG: hypothetical protein KDK54_12245 [Leptospiraceae bacterium]|nr:hypothetical protein [Leptospiraceae bacterium]
MKILLVLLAFLAGLTQIQASPVYSKANETRVDLLRYLRTLEPIVRNYPGKDKEGKEASFEAAEGSEGDRIAKYKAIKRLFQEGMMYYYEGRYPNSYRRFLEAQLNVENLLEDLSQLYIESTDEILKASLEKKDPKGDEANGEYKNATIDKDFVDISVEYGRGSDVLSSFKTDREAPAYGRLYEPREYHYAINKGKIENSVENGYKMLGEAKRAKLAALKIEQRLERHQKLQPEHRKYRIERYIDVIVKCRDARKAAFNIYQLKYANDNEYLQTDEKFTLEGEANNYRVNPYVKEAKLHPVFDNRIPAQYRRDAVDVSGKVFIDEVNEYIKLKHTDVEAVNRNNARYGETQKLDQPKVGEPKTAEPKNVSPN